MKRNGTGPYRTQMRDFVVEVERPSSTELAVYSRAERYRRLRANTEAHRTQLESWLETEDLCSEVGDVRAGTGFNLIFVECTPNVAAQLIRAPGVVEVLPAGELEAGLQSVI